MTSPSTDLQPVVPDHDVLRRIGHGSYGEIWLARAVVTGAWRAVKIVWRVNFESERSFRREFEGLSAFEPISRSHAGFVDILQVGRNDARGFFYYIMELADDHATGRALSDPAAYTPRTLRAVLRERHRLHTPECLTLGASLAEALGALHAHGLSHRDIKPDNIIFVGGEPKLADIGLVAAHGQRSFVGTEGYVPPEGPGGVSADLYSLGKVLYESSMGKDRLDFPAIASDLEHLGPEHGPLMRGLNHLLLRACDPRPSRRYGSAREMGNDLKRLSEGKVSGKKRRFAPGWIMLLVIGTVVAAVVLFHGEDIHRPPPVSHSSPMAPTPTLEPSPPPAPTPHVPSRAPRPDAAWENTLGMKFLPLDGTALVSQWKTRVRDFAAFAKASGYNATGGMSSFHAGADTLAGATWQDPGFAQTPDHPVVGVSWKDAYAFCDWLTLREHESGDLDEEQFYRLPTDLEWSRAVGLPPEPGTTPQTRSNQIKAVYPWGTQWPPPSGAGNYAGAELRAPDVDWPANLPTLPGGFADGFARTSPVGSFAPNRLGFYDLGGNAWEWCEDRFAPGGETRVLRGGSWGNVRADLLLSCKRIDAFPDTRSDLYGFRIVLETPAFGRVEIVSEPVGATVLQNDLVLGQTPLALARVSAGTAAFTVKLDGYLPTPLTGRVGAGAALELRAALVPVQGPQPGQPWENELGMLFVPDGPALLVSVWTTRVSDYERFCRETSRAMARTDFVQGPMHPTVNVSREDAEAFCGWLTARELSAGRLRSIQRYRLPTDREWSHAAGLPDEEGDTPETRDGRVRGVYPWGRQWPPPPGAGNFAVSGSVAGGKHGRRRLTPQGEAYTQTVPVGSFTPNAIGLYDMAGNVWQWCADNYKKNGALRHWGVLRGGSWADYGPSILQSSYRNVVPSGERDVIYGFRCVIDLNSGTPASPGNISR